MKKKKQVQSLGIARHVEARLKQFKLSRKTLTSQKTVGNQPKKKQFEVSIDQFPERVHIFLPLDQNTLKLVKNLLTQPKKKQLQMPKKII